MPQKPYVGTGTARKWSYPLRSHDHDCRRVQNCVSVLINAYVLTCYHLKQAPPNISVLYRAIFLWWSKTVACVICVKLYVKNIAISWFIFQQSASFLSDIGGLMGMWIGISALTIAELLELIATFLITIFKTYSKKKDRVVNVKPKENSAQTY